MTSNGRVPSLRTLCLHAIRRNLSIFDDFGAVPLALLKPALVEAKADKLRSLESANGWSAAEEPDVDDLWAGLLCRDFPSTPRPAKGHAQDVYLAQEAAREDRLRMVKDKLHKEYGSKEREKLARRTVEIAPPTSRKARATKVDKKKAPLFAKALAQARLAMR